MIVIICTTHYVTPHAYDLSGYYRSYKSNYYLARAVYFKTGNIRIHENFANFTKSRQGGHPVASVPCFDSALISAPDSQEIYYIYFSECGKPEVIRQQNNCTTLNGTWYNMTCWFKVCAREHVWGRCEKR